MSGGWGVCLGGVHTYITMKHLCTDRFIDHTNIQTYSFSNTHKANSISPQKCRINGHIDKYTPDIPIHTIRHATGPLINTHTLTYRHTHTLLIHQQHGNEQTSPTLIYHSDWKWSLFDSTLPLFSLLLFLSLTIDHNHRNEYLTLTALFIFFISVSFLFLSLSYLSVPTNTV